MAELNEMEIDPLLTPQHIAHEAASALFHLTKNDSDAASGLVLGDSWDDADGAVFVVRGAANARRVHDWLKAEGLSSEEKIFDEEGRLAE